MEDKIKPLEVKPGWKTTEFWLGLAAIVLVAVMGAQLLEGDWAKLGSAALAVLVSLGYTGGRAAVKRGLKMLAPIALIGVTACAPTLQGKTAQGLMAAKVAADSTLKISEVVLHKKCLEVADGCKASGEGSGCSALVKCHADRASFNGKLKKLYLGLAGLRVAYVAAVASEKGDDTLKKLMLAASEIARNATALTMAWKVMK